MVDRADAGLSTQPPRVLSALSTKVKAALLWTQACACRMMRANSVRPGEFHDPSQWTRRSRRRHGGYIAAFAEETPKAEVRAKRHADHPGQRISPSGSGARLLESLVLLHPATRFQRLLARGDHHGGERAARSTRRMPIRRS